MAKNSLTLPPKIRSQKGREKKRKKKKSEEGFELGGGRISWWPDFGEAAIKWLKNFGTTRPRGGRLWVVARKRKNGWNQASKP